MKPDKFADVLTKLTNHLQQAVTKTLEQAGQLVEDEAKGMIGHEQPSWPPLASATLTRKGLLEPGDPLRRTGQMQDSINHTTIGNTVFVGSNDPVAVIHTHGNAHVPPRPFLRPALYHKLPEIKQMLDKNVASALKKV